MLTVSPVNKWCVRGRTLINCPCCEAELSWLTENKWGKEGLNEQIHFAQLYNEIRFSQFKCWKKKKEEKSNVAVNADTVAGRHK